MDEYVAGDEGLEPELLLAQPVRLRRRRAPWNASGPIVRVLLCCSSSGWHRGITLPRLRARGVAEERAGQLFAATALGMRAGTTTGRVGAIVGGWHL